ncbi:MAG: carboxy-S-adenosyl-L-methionine synthase CmoA [Gammaproteobacteria bacterium]|nr:carboxy-S-adenosyl-L-methionine synthase CmoA [Gammaproteobacteria bacterium]MDH4313799.1 carboxy-S-adenosyl-L-methionine synthase CmoA [Gammaproteobacteria bacterium]MDH5215173.1 carboxy-S-adenosyl-L-methionine synthase CmoA [Gammaproteobacteria bacterium]
MPKDEIYRAGAVAERPFEFNETVAAVFPDMLQRSIPGYAASIEAIGQLASRFVSADTQCYDLGCSLGAATMAMRQNIVNKGCRIIAVDNAEAMVERFKRILADDRGNPDVDVSVLQSDIRHIDISGASMVVLNYTLQFLPVAERLAMLQKIADGMIDGGVLILSEKIVDEDPLIEQMLVDLHHQFKRRNAYSDLEISRKRAALENVLVPETLRAHLERLRNAGFRHAGPWLRYFNFVSILAIR